MGLPRGFCSVGRRHSGPNRRNDLCARADHRRSPGRRAPCHPAVGTDDRRTRGAGHRGRAGGWEAGALRARCRSGDGAPADHPARGRRPMTLLPSGVKIHVALGVTDMRKGLDGLAMLVQGPLKHDPFSGHLFVFRGRKVDLLKILFWDGTGLCLFTKRLESSRFFWSVADEATGSVMLTSAQLSMLIEGIDWRSPERRWRPSVAG